VSSLTESAEIPPNFLSNKSRLKSTATNHGETSDALFSTQGVEARFYFDVLPLLKKNIKEILPDWNIAPTCHLAETYLHGLIDEAESTSAKLSASEEYPDPSYDESDSSILHNKGGVLILESLKGDFYQTSPLTQSQASQCLTAIARFHATAFEDKEILSVVSDKLCEYGGSYHLKNRNPKELENLEKTWENFSNELKVAKPELFEKDSVRNLAKRIKALAEDISMELSPAFDDKYATIVHGDYKAMNVFLPGDGDGDGDGNGEEITKTDENEINGHAIIIDYASTGVGMGMSDVAMHVTHALHPDDLINGGEEALVDIYLFSLQEVMPNFTYPKEIAMRHYRLATIDYFRFVLGRLWRGVTLEAFEKRKSSKNAVFVNRNIEAALYFIERADKFLTEIEEENIST